MKFKLTFLTIILWFIILNFIVGFAIKQFPYQPSFPYANELLGQYGNRHVTTWSQFDGVHYLTIITKGYHGTGLIQAFFPLYPLLIKIISFQAFINPVVIGIGVSLASLICSLYLLNKLLKVTGYAHLGNKVVLLLLLFPTSFYFSAVYTESLFLLLSIATFYFAINKKWWTAAICAALASSTRLVGLVLWPALLLEYWPTFKQTSFLSTIKTKPLQLASLLIPPSGLIAYMGYLHFRFNDPLLFIHVQHEFGANRETQRLVLLYQVFYRYARMLLTVNKSSTIYYTIALEFIAGIYGSVCSIISCIKLRPSFALYASLSFIIPTLTGTFSSLPRYLLVIFPFFILTAQFLPSKLLKLWLLGSSILLGYNLMLFTRGLWVA